MRTKGPAGHDRSNCGPHGARSLLILVWGVLLGGMLPVVTGPLAAQDKPPLSEEIRSTYLDGGAEAAQARYQEILEGERDAFEFDMQAMLAIGSEYAQTGNIEAAQVFYMIGSQMAMAQFESSEQGVLLNAMMDSARVAEEARESADAEASAEASAASEDAPDAGPTRNDLDRFFGLYRDPEPPGTADYDIMVSETCDGRLVMAPMWADVSPYIMRSEGDARFVQIWVSDFQAAPYQLEFELGPGGRPTSVTHNLTAEFTFERWARVGDLPEGFTDCLSTLR